MIPIIIKSIGDWIATHWRGVSCYVAGLLTVVCLMVWCQKPPLPPSTHTVTLWDTLPPPHAIHDTVPVKQVVRHYLHDTTILRVHDTTVMVISSVVDSESCISGHFVAPDSAKVDWSACSKEFPYHLSDKISWDVKYVAAPSIIEHQNRYDTIPMQATAWQKVKTATMWATIGAVIGAGVVEYFNFRR